jgi:phosphoglycolate phosphatase
MTMPTTVFLDLDGTLIDPKPGIIGSVQYALRQMGQEPPPVEALTWAIGPPLRKTFTKLLGEAHAEEAVTHYRTFYGQGAMYDCAVYPGIPETLARLASGGHRLVVVTAKAHVFARPIVSRLGLDEHVAAVYGPELDGTRDNKVDLLAHVLAAEAVSPEAAIMVGDRQFDILAAVANGVTGVGVTWGYGSADELKAAGAGLLCHAPADLVHAAKLSRD